MSRFQFAADRLHAFELNWLCAVVEVARSSFYTWLAAADGRAAARTGKTSGSDSNDLSASA